MADEEEPAKPSSSAALRAVVVWWGAVALVQFVLFLLFRQFPKFKRVYNVRDTVDRLKCELAARDLGTKWNFFAWIPHVWNATEDEIFEQVGLDALCYLRTVRMGMKLSLMGCFIAVWSIPTYFTSPKETEKLVASNATASTDESLLQRVPRSNFNVTDTLDRMSMGHTYMGDPRMSSSLLAAYLISVFAMWLLRKEFNWYIIQRYRYLRRQAPQNYSLFIHSIPPDLRSETALAEYFGTFFHDIHSIHFVKKVPKLEKLCAKRDVLKGQFEHNEALLEKIQAEQPGAFAASFRAQGTRVAETKAKLDKDREQLDETTAALRQRIEELEAEWDAHNKAVTYRNPAALASPPANVLDAAFISFKSLQSATCARQLNHHELPFNVLAEEAPVPGHVVWHNCGMNHYRKTLQQVLAIALTVAICIFWVIPMAFVASFQKVEELKKFGPSGCEEAGNCPIKVASDFFPLLDSILAILAPLALISLSYMLPVILWYVVALEGHIGMNTFHASLFFKLTLFMIVQTFFVSAIAGALFAELDAFIQEPLNKGQEILANTLPAQAVTFMGLIFVKSTYKLMMELLRPRSALYGWLRTFIGPRLTEAERAKDYFGLTPLIWVLRPFSSPGPLKYHVLFPDLVLMFTILFVYSVLSPISNLVLLPAFCFLNIGNRHQMIYIYDPSNDTGGQLWPQFARYMMVSMLIAQVTVFGVLGLNESAAAPLMIPLMVGTVLFSRYMRQQHPRVAQTMPMPMCHAADRQHRADTGDDCAFLTDKYKQKCLIVAQEVEAAKRDHDHETELDRDDTERDREDVTASERSSRTISDRSPIPRSAHLNGGAQQRSSELAPWLSAEEGGQAGAMEVSVDAAIGVVRSEEESGRLGGIDLRVYDMDRVGAPAVYPRPDSFRFRNTQPGAERWARVDVGRP